MNHKFFIALFCLSFALLTKAQNADNLVALGRAFLVTSNLSAAQTKFEAALAIAPQHQAALLFRAANRLALLPNGTPANDLMNRLGIPATGRNIYAWTALPPVDTNGAPLAPTGVSAAEAVFYLRQTVLPAVLASEADFAGITNRNFILRLRKAEIQAVDVYVDYADVLMLRAMLSAAEYFIYTTYSWNVDVQLSALRTLYDRGLLSIERVLAENPQLLTFANTNDFFAAQLCFRNAANRYLEASDAIRARPGAEPARLFNFEPEEEARESQFRCLVANLRDSLDHPVVLCIDTNYTLALATHFNGSRSFRSFLPAFYGNKIAAGSFPDATFGGIITGLTEAALESFLAKHLPVAPWMGRGEFPFPDMFAFHFTTVIGRVYTLEYSSDLKEWRTLVDFQAERSTYSYGDWAAPDSAIGFYRLRDVTDNVTLEGEVVDACSDQPLAGAVVLASLAETGATTDSSGHFLLHTQARSCPGTCQAFVQAPDHQTWSGTIYCSGNKMSGLKFLLMPNVITPPPNDYFANRIVLTGLPVVASGTVCGASPEAYESPGILNPVGLSIWWSWTAPSSGLVSIATDRDGAPMPIICVYTGASIEQLQLIASGSGNDTTLEAVAGTTYQIYVDLAQPGPGPQPVPSPQGAIRLSIEPLLQPVLTSPSYGQIYTAPVNILLSGTASGGSDPIRLYFFAVNVSSGESFRVTITNRNGSYLWTNVLEGEYYVSLTAMGQRGGGPFTSIWFQVVAPAPANDNFANRIALTGSTVTVFGSNRGATPEWDEPFHAGSPAAYSVWWSWTAPVAGPVTINAFGNNLGSASRLGVYQGNTLSTLTCIASNEFFGARRGSQVSFFAPQGTTYQIAVDGSERGDDFLLQIWPDAAPTVFITSPPNGAAFRQGTNVTVSVSSGDADGSIGWVELYSGTTLLGIGTGTPCSFTLSNVAAGTLQLRAVAVDNLGLAGISSPVAVRLVEPNPYYQDIAKLVTDDTAHIMGVTTVGDYAYAVDDSGSLYTFIIAGLAYTSPFVSLRPIAPPLRLTLNYDPGENGLISYGQYLYAWSAGGQGLQIINVSQPAAPALVRTILPGTYIDNALLAGSNLLALESDGFEVFSLANPTNPAVISQVRFGYPTWAATVYRTNLYVGELDGPVHIYSFVNPSNVTELASRNLPFSYHMYALDTNLVLSIDDYLYLYSLANPLDPSFLMSTYIYGPTGPGRVCAVDGNHVILGGTIYTATPDSLDYFQSFDTHWGDNGSGFPYHSSILSGPDYRLIFLSQSQHVLVLLKQD